VRFRTIERGGRYLRLADPDWNDPLDGGFAKARGGRWNAPGAFEVLYLNADRKAARLNVERLLADQPFGPEDLDPDEAFLLVATDIPVDDYADIVTGDGCAAVGLPASFPVDADGSRIGHDRCQPIGQRAHDVGLPGIACRSCVDGAGIDDEELAYFVRATRLVETRRWHFDEWFWSD
jgi:RES domain